jgi:hypothetical protein
MMAHLEKCYADSSSQRDAEQILALEIFRAMEKNKQQLTKGILKAVTMVYQDMLRVRERPGEGRVMHCMHRIGGFRFNRSITVVNLRTLNMFWSNPFGPQELLLKLARRAIHFHDFIKEYSGKGKVDVQGKEVVPIEAGIHLPSSKAN